VREAARLRHEKLEIRSQKSGVESPSFFAKASKDRSAIADFMEFLDRITGLTRIIFIQLGVLGRNGF
jgi:hypothetical protein